MKNGWIKLHRRIRENYFWKEKPFDRARAWLDMLLLANHKRGHIRIRGNRVPLKRGDLGWGERAMAGQWGWSRGKVRRFLEELVADHQIVLQPGGLTTVISIVRYEHYQAVGAQTGPQTDHPNPQNGTTERTETGHPTGPQTGGATHGISMADDPYHQADGTTDSTTDSTTERSKKRKKQYPNKNGSNKKKKEEVHTASGDAAQKDGVDFLTTKRKRKLTGKRWVAFKRFWDAFDDKRGKREAADAWLDIPPNGLTNALVSEIVAAAERYAAGRQELKDGGSTPKMAQGWITAWRWEDENVGLPAKQATPPRDVSSPIYVYKFTKADSE